MEGIPTESTNGEQPEELTSIVLEEGLGASGGCNRWW
jgi:hypothetical protein